MRPARAFALGLLHGPAELLPVSSSAHAGLFLRGTDPERRKELEVALHAGALLALGPPRPAPWLAIATLPPALAGFLLERPIEQHLGGPRTTALGLVLGGAAMAAADHHATRTTTHRATTANRGQILFANRGQILHSHTGFRCSQTRSDPCRETRSDPSVGEAVVLGLAQAAALVPGVSRHGAALTALRARGFAREDAHAISREASKPVLLGATALKGLKVRRDVAPLAAAAAGSALSTLAASRALAGRGVRSPLWPFALYRAALAASVWRHG